MPRVHQINISDGGVPKAPVAGAHVGERGVEGDRQEDRVHHGHSDQALCLYSLEVIQGLQAEGHRIAPGSAGENLTLTDLDWSTVVPGVRMRIGEQLEIEITAYTPPCSKNAQWFVDGEFGRMSQARHPGESRVYARVISAGHITTGDPVQLLG